MNKQEIGKQRIKEIIGISPARHPESGVAA